MSPVVVIPYGLGILATAGAVHLATILMAPSQEASHDAFARIVAIAPANALTLPRTASDLATLPDRDAAMSLAVCRFDVRSGPLRITIEPFRATLLSIGLHGRGGAAFYGLNLASGDHDSMALVVMDAAQRAKAEDADGDDASAHDLRITTPEPEGFVTIESPNAEPILADEALGHIRCETAVPDPSSKAP